MVQAVLGVVLLVGAVAMFHYYAPSTAQGAQPEELQKQVTQLTRTWRNSSANRPCRRWC